MKTKTLLLLLAIGLSISVDTSGAVTVTTTLSGVTNASASGPTLATSANFDMAGGNAVALLVTLERSGSGDAISATFAGQSMTLGVSISEGVQWSGIFYLIAPALTSGQFVITTTGTSAALGYSAISLFNVDSVADFDAVANTSTGTTISLTTSTTNANGFVLGAAVNNGYSTSNPAPSFVSGDADQVLLPSTLVSSSGHLHSYGDVPAAGSNTNVYGNTVQRNAYVTLAFESGTAQDTTPPAAPTGLAASAGNNNVSVNWPDNTEPDLASYNVYRSTTSGSYGAALVTGLTQSAYSDSTAVNGTTYYYVVSAVDTSNNESANSNEASATPHVLVRNMEKLDRGVVAVRSSSGAFISWRLLGLDPSGIAFNIYRSANGGAWTKLNGSPLTGGCNYTDSSANLTVDNTYRINPVIGGEEQPSDGQWTLPANTTQEPLFRIPLQTPVNRRIEKVWVGDVDGDGAYEYALCWTATVAGETQKLQVYKVDGTLLWEADFGLYSTVTDDPYCYGNACISAGQWDGVTVYDFDSDGYAEVIVKSANGVTFGDGTTLNYSDNITQFLSVLDGRTDAELARTELTHPWKTLIGRGLSVLFGVGYPDGERPSLMIHGKSRNPDGSFNTINSAWDYRGDVISNRWSIQWDGDVAPEAGHQIRLVDLDGDGKDELFPGVHAIDDNGTLLYNMQDWGVGHGDRWQVGDMDPSRPGLEMFGVQQNNASGLHFFVADAATGHTLWEYYGDPGDVGRGCVADLDPGYPGMEVWAFEGVFSVDGTQVSTNYPWPNLVVWWDGDLFGENLNEETLDKWNYDTQSVSRLLTIYHYGTTLNSRSICAFQGDIIGDWREEMVFDSDLHNELIVFTTDIPTTHRLYTLTHNPAYRNCITTQGYRQQHLPDYYLGDGMTTPPTPNIVYVGSTPDTTPPAAPTSLNATAGDATVSLNWADSTEPDLAGYNVYRSLSSGHSYTAVATDVVVSSYIDNTAQNGTAYYYVVTAVDTSSNESDYSNEVSATPQDTTPPTPNPATFATAPYATGSGSITMVATTGSDTSGPVQYLFTETSGNPGGTSSGWQTSDTYVDSGLNASTQYTYTVTMRDALGNTGTASAPASATTQSATPTFVAAGSVASGTGTITPALPSGIASGDILLLFVETANQAVSISNPNGGTWAAVTGSPQGTGTAGGTSATCLTVFWSRYNGTQGAPTVSDSGNRQLARMIAIRGAVATGNPWDVTAGGVEATSDTSGSIPGATTTVANTLVVVAVAGSLPDSNGTSNFSAWTNANLTSLTERTDNTSNAGNGGALGIATGIKATAGAYSNTTVTHASSAVKGMISIAIKK